MRGIQAPNPDLEMQAQAALAEEPVILTPSQRSLVERTIKDHCRIRGWTLHAVNVRTNPVHVVVSAHRQPADLMDQFKAWCSRKLSDDAGLITPVARKAGRRRWFTEGGDKQRIEDEEHLANAIHYVMEGQ
jgi:REP element-mobilizing transposase RayT